MEINELILEAIKKGSPMKQKKLKSQEVEPDLFPVESDAIWNMGQKLKKVKEFKKVEQWSNTDFLKHFKKLLSPHGLKLEPVSPKEINSIKTLYDKLVSRIKDNMNSGILKEYLDWWVACYASSSGREIININYISQDFLVDRFVNRFDLLENVSSSKVKDEKPVVSDEQIYQLGGLPMLLISRGIVISYNLLQKENGIILRISNTMRELTKESVAEVIESTLRLAPYPQSHKIDFVSVAKQSIDYHGLKGFNSLQYDKYFC